MKRNHPAVSILAAAWLVSACAPVISVPEGFPPPPEPEDNRPSAVRVELGKKLFNDTRLSRTGAVSCASCHVQERAFADPRALSVGVEGRTGTRNAPPLFNLAWNTTFFWDGGAKTLEQQSIGPITNPLEMDMTMAEVVARIGADSDYVKLFHAAYGADPRPDLVTKGLATFERTMVSGNSRYDRYTHGNRGALDAAEQRGAEIAMGERGECFHCHVGFNLTNNQFANNGMTGPDRGRQKITENAADWGKFKVPTLRNVALTAPYMHDGSLATLRDVVEHYSRGGQGHPNTDPTIQPLDFTEQEKVDLVAFLGSLTDESLLKNPRLTP
jgi:cytochrome c peroxidase